MSPSPRRPFTIADGMILVAASAVGLLMTREYLPGVNRHLQFYQSDYARTTLYFVFQPYKDWLFRIPKFLVVSWMAALIILRLRAPRPRFRRLTRQPGFLACVVAMISLVPGLMWAWTIGTFRLPSANFRFIADIATHWTGISVLGAWMALALGGRWRAEPSWIDRSGRALGAFWVLGIVMGLVEHALGPLILQLVS